ncbi:MAG: hypothetical protein JSU01_02085 [Bacteroidetes bacterium]|nr:hypothetical protein [Bacteroidota bacterium]
MLRIEILSDGRATLDLQKFNHLEMPVPESGIDLQENGNVVLLFEDEQEAVSYSLELDRFSETLNNHPSPQYEAVGEVMKAISEDKFVQAYFQD